MLAQHQLKLTLVYINRSGCNPWGWGASVNPTRQSIIGREMLSSIREPGSTAEACNPLNTQTRSAPKGERAKKRALHT